MDTTVEVALERDGDGYLVDRDSWTPEIGQAMAEADEYELNDVK